MTCKSIAPKMSSVLFSDKQLPLLTIRWSCVYDFPELIYLVEGGEGTDGIVG